MEDRRARGDFGVSAGLVCAALLVLAHIAADFLLAGFPRNDIVLWLVRIAAYFVAGLIAANSQFQIQKDADDSLAGVQSAGRGAAIILCVSFWVYLIIRSIVLDDPGMFAFSGVIPSMCLSVFDFLLAVILGSQAGRVVERQHEYMDD